MILQMTCSDGGPIIAIPAELAASWRGTVPPIGVVVPDGWQWSGVPEILCDYDRACYHVQDFVNNGDSGFGWVMTAGTDGMALIFDMELPTTFLNSSNGGIFIRGLGGETLDSEEAVAEVNKIAASDWKDYPKELVLTDGRIFAFDSAYPGYANPNDITADDGVLIVQLLPGKYHVKYCTVAAVEFVALSIKL